MAFPVTDDFNRADSTTIGGNWVERRGGWEIVSNKLKCLDTAFGRQHIHNTGDTGTDVYVQVTLNGNASNQDACGPIARRVDASGSDSNFVFASLNNSGSSIRVRAFKVIGSTITELGESLYGTYDNTADYVVKLEVDGTSPNIEMRIYVGGTLRHTQSSINETGVDAAGDTGCYANSASSSLTFDDFDADAIGGGPPAATPHNVFGLALKGPMRRAVNP